MPGSNSSGRPAQASTRRGEVHARGRAELEAVLAVDAVDRVRVVEAVREPGGVREQVPDPHRLDRRHVSGLFWLPPAHTRTSANAGMNCATGSLSSNAPSSHSSIAATDVIGLVIE